MENVKKLRSANKYIKVTYPDGLSICYKNVTLTYLEVLRRLTREQLASIRLEINHLPIISQEIYPKYEKYMKPIVRGWYVNTQSDSSQKYLQLRAINDQLQLGLFVEIGADLEPTSVRGFEKAHKPKDNLLVQFPDGNYVGEENAKATYVACIRKLGVELIRRKGLQFTEKDMLTAHKMYNDQILLEEEKLWLVVPPTTKLKYRALSSIALHLHVNLSITII